MPYSFNQLARLIFADGGSRRGSIPLPTEDFSLYLTPEGRRKTGLSQRNGLDSQSVPDLKYVAERDIHARVPNSDLVFLINPRGGCSFQRGQELFERAVASDGRDFPKPQPVQTRR